MQSQPVKRVVAGALTATAVITAVCVGAPASAVTLTSVPALQAPPTNSADALAQYRAAAAQAEQLNEEALRAQEDFNAKQADVAKANADIAGLTQQVQTAQAQAAQFQTVVDKFADASFVSGAQYTKLSALLSGTSAQDFLDRSSALAVLANDKNKALAQYTGAVQAAATAQQQATDARNRAQAASDAAQQTLNDLHARQDALNKQVNDLKQISGRLTAAEKALQQDKGGAAPNVPAPTAAAQQAIDVALSKLGDPYVWGATGPDQFDCSGLMVYSYGKAGVSLPRTAASQQSAGVAVPLSAIQPGDLLFEGSPAYHVVMYLGDGKVVQAPTSGDVVKVSAVPNNVVNARRVAT
ncbi:NlpC/P60 family protein [Amycolatopsis sp. K13G38]|uniref:NlpC/P60 family protein n=1 Tax=Amycolatopsis acididurans TaxID=2724524 RepID=A0ABX1J9S3_9PSEU|nr:C40 family peptidase [Amycolatopsis acididurans]NKQ56538.1 NlpC/P60 family protein [Amycolatopsis acididurans]